MVVSSRYVIPRGVRVTAMGFASVLTNSDVTLSVRDMMGCHAGALNSSRVVVGAIESSDMVHCTAEISTVI
jgi:uncharacterized membrane protein